MVFYTLYLMAPLLKRHFSLAWHGVATEGVYMRGTKSQSCGWCIYKMSHIFIGLRGGRGLKRLSCGFPPSPSQKCDLLVTQIGNPISYWVSPRSQWWIPGGTLSSLRVTSQQISSMSCHIIICKIPKVYL